MISIIMTTYNGEKYIVEQLDSIRNQKRKADEVIICDDKSVDDTVLVVKEYIKKWGIDNWFVYVNETNLGWKRNFYCGLQKTRGDYIFFSDQDDYWMPEKLSRMSAVLESHDDISVLCCTTEFINGEGEAIKVDKEALPYGHFSGEILSKNTFTNKFIYSIMPGCTMGIKKEFVNYILPKEKNVYYELPHDALFWKIATLTGSAFILNENLIKYRIHDNNSSSPQMKSSFKPKKVNTRLAEIEKNEQELIMIKQILEMNNIHSPYKESLDKLIVFCRWRKKFVEKRNIHNFLYQIKYYRNMKMLLGDIVAMHNRSK